MTDIKSADGQYGYFRTDVAGEWRKVRLATNETVATIALGGDFAAKPRHRKSDAIMRYPQRLPPPQASGVPDAWEGSYGLDYYTRPPASLPCLPPAEKRAVAARKSAYGRHGLNYCAHDGKAKVWEADGREYYAAGISFIRPTDYALVLDLADQVGTSFRRSWADDQVILPGSPDKFQYLNRFQVKDGKLHTAWLLPGKPKNVVHFRWHDGAGLTPVGVEFWEHLIDTMPKGKILICCIGSHGRTGTCLAALMLGSGTVESAYEAVLRTRIGHCESAIESYMQLQYLDRLAHTWGYEGPEAVTANRVPFGESQKALDALTATKAAAAAAASEGGSSGE